MKNFSDLSEQQLLALAISLEEEDSRIYGEFAHELDGNYPDTANMFRAMGREESGHRHRLLNLYRRRFGEHIPLIRREDVKGLSGESLSGYRGRSVSTRFARRTR